MDKILSIFTRLPFISSLNRLLGLVFGLFEGALVIGIIFYFIARFPVGEQFMAWTSASIVVPYTVKIAGVLWPILPDAIKALQSTVGNLM